MGMRRTPTAGEELSDGQPRRLALRRTVSPSGFFLKATMRILVQDRRTNAFLTRDAKWAKQLDYARPFPTSIDALRFCVERELRDMDVLVCYPGHRNSLRLPLC